MNDPGKKGGPPPKSVGPPGGNFHSELSLRLSQSPFQQELSSRFSTNQTTSPISPSNSTAPTTRPRSPSPGPRQFVESESETSIGSPSSRPLRSLPPTTASSIRSNPIFIASQQEQPPEPSSSPSRSLPRPLPKKAPPPSYGFKTVSNPPSHPPPSLPPQKPPPTLPENSSFPSRPQPQTPESSYSQTFSTFSPGSAPPSRTPPPPPGKPKTPPPPTPSLPSSLISSPLPPPVSSPPPPPVSSPPPPPVSSPPPPPISSSPPSSEFTKRLALTLGGKQTENESSKYSDVLVSPRQSLQYTGINPEEENEENLEPGKPTNKLNRLGSLGNLNQLKGKSLNTSVDSLPDFAGKDNKDSNTEKKKKEEEEEGEGSGKKILGIKKAVWNPLSRLKNETKKETGVVSLPMPSGQGPAVSGPIPTNSSGSNISTGSKGSTIKLADSSVITVTLPDPGLTLPSMPSPSPETSNIDALGDPLAGSGVKTSKRDHIVREILGTERSYVQSIILMIETYLRPLQKIAEEGVKDKENTNIPLITKQQIKKIFSNIETILPINQEILKDLEERWKNWSSSQLIGDIFLNMGAYFKMYGLYGQGCKEAMETIEGLLAKEQFYSLYEVMRENTGKNIELNALLIMPIQRIPRYNLLLTDLLVNTTEDHPDYRNLKEALQTMRDVTDSMNEAVRKVENLKKLASASEKGKGFRGLMQAHRRLIIDSLLQVIYVNGSKQKEKLHFFLFNDMLIYTTKGDLKKQTDMSKISSQWPLMFVWVTEVTVNTPPLSLSLKEKDLPPELSNCFEVVGPNKSFVIQCGSEEKQKWMDHFTTYIGNAIAERSHCDTSRRYGEYEIWDGAFYEGWWLNGKLSGTGTLRYNGMKYEGEWENNMRSGTGTLIYSTMDTYNGLWQNDKPNGFGVLCYNSKDVYSGEWKDGCKHGQGRMEYANGDTYTGEWVYDLACGNGKLIFSNGTVYEGDFEEHKFHGNGTLTTVKGKTYTGGWKYGRRSGRGSFHDAIEGTIYEGNWVDDQRHGNGVFTNKNDFSQYKGEWVHDVRHGKGQLQYKDGSRYEGQFKSNLRHGKGTLFFSDGSSYTGHFKRDLPDGAGVYTYDNGVTFEGKWTKGNKDGKFTFTLTPLTLSQSPPNNPPPPPPNGPQSQTPLPPPTSSTPPPPVSAGFTPPPAPVGSSYGSGHLSYSITSRGSTDMHGSFGHLQSAFNNDSTEDYGATNLPTTLVGVCKYNSLQLEHVETHSRIQPSIGAPPDVLPFYICIQ